MSNFKAILFDFDGVIADTMVDNFSAWGKAFLDYGIKIKRADYFPLEGYSTKKIAEVILKKYYNKKNIDPQKIADLKHHYYLLNGKFKLYPGVLQIIKFLKKINLPLALVTGADQRRIKSSIPKLLNEFNVVITGDDKIDSKPSPDCYLTAAKKLGINPEECLVIENALLGIQSAKMAGCFCFAITTTMDPKNLDGADEVLESHKELLNRLKIIFD